MLISVVLRSVVVVVLGFATLAVGVWQRQGDGSQLPAQAAPAVWPAPAGLEPGGWGFEILHRDQLVKALDYDGDSSSEAERLVANEKVVGSNPTRCSTRVVSF